MSMNNQMERPRRRSRLVRLERPRVRTTYQLQAELGHRIKDDEESYKAARQEIIDWLAKKAPVELPALAMDGASYVVDEHGQRIECVSLPGRGIWTCRMSHPDTGMGDIPAVPGRHWTTDLCLRQVNGKTLFGVHVSCAMLREDDAPLVYARPAIVRNIAKRTGLTQVRPIMHEPWVIKGLDDVAALERLLVSEERMLPVILMTVPDRRKWQLTQNAPPAYLIDALYLAKEAQGFAHVVQLPYEVGFEWTKKIGPQWSAFDGAIRIYHPGLNFDEDSLHQHPLYRKDVIWYHKYKDHSGPTAFLEQLYDHVRATAARYQWTAPELLTIGQARLLETELNAAQTRELTKVKEEAFRTALAKLSEAEHEKSQASETAARMQELVTAKDSEIRSLTERVTALEEAVKTAQEEEEKWSDEAVQAGRDRDYYQNQIGTLRNQMNALRASLEAKTGEIIDEAIEIPESYDELPDWVDKHLTGRLELLPRAVRTLKDATYEDVKLVYRSLLLLANEYRDMRTGMGDKEKFENAMAELGLKLSGSIDRSRAGAEGETYFVRYPVGTYQREFLEFHLRKGKVKDDRHCLAVYFFWHDESKQVVVGSLPAHLDNQLS